MFADTHLATFLSSGILFARPRLFAHPRKRYGFPRPDLSGTCSGLRIYRKVRNTDGIAGSNFVASLVPLELFFDKNG